MELVHFSLGIEGGVRRKEFVKMSMFDILCDYLCEMRYNTNVIQNCGVHQRHRWFSELARGAEMYSYIQPFLFSLTVATS